jgi:hypothetical protein
VGQDVAETAPGPPCCLPQKCANGRGKRGPVLTPCHELALPPLERPRVNGNPWQCRSPLMSGGESAIVTEATNPYCVPGTQHAETVEVQEGDVCSET